MKTQLVAALAAFGIASAFAADWSYTESGNIQIPEITENSTITISSGKTVTNATALVGTGLLTVKGGGTLYLTQASPSFSGGVYLDVGDVAVTTSGAFGKGTVTLHGDVKSKVPSKVIFANGNESVEFDNAFVIENVGAQANPNLYFGGGALGTVTLSGSVNATATPCWTGSAAKSTVEFTGAVTAQTFECYGSATYHFRGKVVANTLYAYSASGQQSSTVHLYSSENRIGQLQNRANAYLHLDGENVAGGAGLEIASTKGIYLHGRSQVVSCLKNTAGSIYGTTTGDSGTPFLTLTGGVATATCSATATGAMGYIIDDKGAEGIFTQIQSGGAHTMTGPITVKRGTFSIQGAATYKNVPSLAIEGGTLEIATTAASPFAALTFLSVGATGKLKIASGLAMPFPNNQTVDVSFETGAAYEGDDIEILAKSLTLDGQEMGKGVWTHDDNAAIPEGITVSMVSKKIEITESGDIDFAATYGAIDGYWQVTVASGVTVNNTTALAVAAGNNVIEFTGGGTFVQQAASPSFDAEIRIGKMTLAVTQENALGSGSVTISGYAKEKGSSRLYFDTGDASVAFANDIQAKTGCGSSQDQDSLLKSTLVFAGSETGKVTLSGTVSLASGKYDIYGLTTTTVEFSQTVSADELYLFGAAYYDFSGPVTASLLFAWSVSGGSSAKLLLHSSENAIGVLKSRKNALIDVYATNGVGGASITFEGKGLDLHGTDQLAASVQTTTVGSLSAGDAAVLTLTGGVAVAKSVAKLEDGLSLVVDDKSADGDFVQVFTNGVHTMTGMLTVKRGTLDLMGSATFKEVSGVNVEGGELVLETTAATFGTVAEVKKAEIDLTIATDARVRISGGLTVNVNRLRINGKGFAAGDYTGVGGPAAAKALPQLSGTGILHVGRSTGQGLIMIFR